MILLIQCNYNSTINNITGWYWRCRNLNRVRPYSNRHSVSSLYKFLLLFLVLYDPSVRLDYFTNVYHLEFFSNLERFITLIRLSHIERAWCKALKILRFIKRVAILGLNQDLPGRRYHSPLKNCSLVKLILDFGSVIWNPSTEYSLYRIGN